MGDALTAPWTRDDRECELARRRLPDGRTWLSIAETVCADLGELLDDALELRRSSIVARAAAYCVLLDAGYSYPLIARGWCVDHTSVIYALKRYHPEAVARRSAEYRASHQPGQWPGLVRREVPAVAVPDVPAANTGATRTGTG